MAKYIGKFADIAALQTAVEQGHISRPFVALTEDNDQLVYGPKLNLAKVGDIVVYGVSEDQIYYIKQANYNTTDFPTADYVPIGVVCRNQQQYVSTFQNEDVRVMSLKWQSSGNPEGGSSTVSEKDPVLNYCSGFAPYHNFSSIEEAKLDLDGRNNSNKVINQMTLPEDWKTRDTLSPAYDKEYGYPYCLAWRWKTPGTNHGDWYIPAAGEILEVLENDELFNLMNSSLSMVGGAAFIKTSSSYLYMPLTSSWANGRCVITNRTGVTTSNSMNGFSRAITSLAITELKK